MDRRRRNDWLLVGGLLAAALALWLILRPGEAGAWAEVYVDGALVGRYALTEDRTVTVGGADYNVLTIADGAVRVSKANCPDHTCVRTGAVSRAGERILCLPHRMSVRVVGGAPAALDAVAG